jgi:phenylalanyl-tRNA synthetase beta chain
MQTFEEAKGGLKGLVIGAVLSTEKHPNADKLTLTKVDIGTGEPLSIVCGAPNVAAGQKVIVAPVGTTIYPTNSNPITMKLAKIRGEESQGMICAEDEIGLGDSHAGILVLPTDVKVGTPANEYFDPYEDIIYEIGLTPNRMDAMSHLGVARDVCAYLSHHDKKSFKPVLPDTSAFKVDEERNTISVSIENQLACPRYSGISISGINVAPSPKWLQNKLKAIGLRPINNIVDITNFIQHETGQPLHAFDAKAITGNKVVIKNVAEGTPFVTLDEKERKLSAEDLMICNTKESMCIAGVFGGLHSGVTNSTTELFLESAFFEGIGIRRTSFRHGLRTDAATRFEKGADISATVTVLKRAALLIKEIAGGTITSSIIDVYPTPKEKVEVGIKWQFIKKLSGKNYHPDAVKNILGSLGFGIVKEGQDEIRFDVPYHKPDISLPADIVEEIVRIDGLDNIEIPTSIMITPSIGIGETKEVLKEKLANYLAGLGYHEMMTNSITNEAYFTEEEKKELVKMINSLSAELNVMRPSLFETSMEVVAHNLNHKNNSLKLFEFGKSYLAKGVGEYEETERLCLVLSGGQEEFSWRQKDIPADLLTLKGAIAALFKTLGISADAVSLETSTKLKNQLTYKINNTAIATAGEISKESAAKFGIKQAVYFAELNWSLVAKYAEAAKIVVAEIAKYPAVQRDLAMLLPKSQAWADVEQAVQKIKINKLRDIKLFDIFESEKLGADKKSIAINFTFQDEEKTLTDKEIEGWMSKIIGTLEKEVNAEIRK